MFADLLRSNRPPALLKLRSSAGLIVTTASFAVLTDVFLYAVIVPVLPFSLTERAGIDEKDVQYWVSISLAVYGAALLASSPCWGYLADRIRNRKIPMLFGLILLSGSTVFLCVARNIAMLLAGRVLQGLSAALTWTVGLALVVDTVDAQHIGRAMGWIGMATSIGILVAPLLGGVVYGRGGYYAVFAMCFGLLAVDIILRLAIIEVKEARKWLSEHEEEEGGETATSEPVQRIEGQGDKGIDHVLADDNPGVLEKGEVAAPAAAPTLTSTPKETLPTGRQGGIVGAIKPFLSLLSKPRLLAALWGTLVHSIIQTSFDSTLPLLVESLFHWDSIGAGLIFLPIVLPAFLSPLIGALGDRYGPKWLATCGFLIATPFLVCLRFVEDNTIGDKVMLCGLLVGVGITIALVFGPLMAEITWSVTGDGADAEAMSVAPYAQAYGLYNMAFSGGALVGPILGGLIRDSAGWPTVCWVLGLVTAVTAVTQFFWVGRPLKLKFPGLGTQ